MATTASTAPSTDQDIGKLLAKLTAQTSQPQGLDASAITNAGAPTFADIAALEAQRKRQLQQAQPGQTVAQPTTQDAMPQTFKQFGVAPSTPKQMPSVQQPYYNWTKGTEPPVK